MNYETLIKQINAITEDVEDEISNFSNISAILNEFIEDINWVGFYFLKNGKLVLGPFQGKVACTEIEIGKGVCGTAVKNDEVLLVKNVHEFPGHIACDSRSNSEIVLPIHKNDAIYGVLDVDSTTIDRFSDEDKNGLKLVVQAIEKILK